MQLAMYKIDIKVDALEKRHFKLSQKWLIESELWLTFLIIIELTTIYRMATINDKRLRLASEMGLTEGEIKQMENKE